MEINFARELGRTLEKVQKGARRAHPSLLPLLQPRSFGVNQFTLHTSTTLHYTRLQSAQLQANFFNLYFTSNFLESKMTSVVGLGECRLLLDCTDMMLIMIYLLNLTRYRTVRIKGEKQFPFFHHEVGVLLQLLIPSVHLYQAHETDWNLSTLDRCRP